MRVRSHHDEWKGRGDGHPAITQADHRTGDDPMKGDSGEMERSLWISSHTYAVIPPSGTRDSTTSIRYFR
jgi:hypothetical protein